jgi:hypothetical protein
VPVFPNDISHHVMYSLRNPSESERLFSPLAASPESRFCRHWAGGGGDAERNGLPIGYTVRQGRHNHWPRRSHDPKGPISLVLGSWCWDGGYKGEGMGTGNEGEGGGIFFTADLCRHLSHWRFSKVCILLIVPVG